LKSHWIRLRPRVLRRIKPSPAQTRKAQAAAKRLSKLAVAAAKPYKVPITPFVVGSLAKDTHLRPRPDIDLFLLFPTSVSRPDLEKYGIAIGKRVLKKPTLRYAEHPYVRGTFAGFDFDVVPAYKVETGAGKMSAVDRSPFHAAYVRKHLSKQQQDEVRILKRFLQGIGCYGAETATGGFSGYLAELFVLLFGSFWQTLVALREESPPIRLALKGKAPPLGGDLVVIDPVDPSRNAAAAVHREKLDTFLRAARAFTARPRLEFFWPTKPRTQNRDQLYSHMSHRGIVGLDLGGVKVREEARVPHARRFAEKVVRRLEDEGFKVVRHAVYPVSARRLLLLWEHEPVALGAEYVHEGPPVDAASHSRRFLEKWQNHPDALELPHPHEGRWRVRVRRREREASQILAKALPELLKGLEVSAAAKRRLRPQTAMDFAQVAALRPALTMFLVPRDPWDDG
jgi:tRNA nucleotidyltransferase (CCA-adding enzyme)